MFEIESKNPDEIVITTKTKTIKFDLAKEEISADLEVGNIVGPGEFEVGEAAIRGIATGPKAQDDEESAVRTGKTVYDVKIGNVHVGIIGGVEEAITLDELGVADILCTSSVRAVREIGPKVAIAMGNIDGMVTELKLSARAEKKYKVKSLDSLPATLEVVALS